MVRKSMSRELGVVKTGKAVGADAQSMPPSGKSRRQLQTEILVEKRQKLEREFMDLAIEHLDDEGRLGALQLRDDIAQLEVQIISEIDRLRETRDSAEAADRRGLDDAKEEISEMRSDLEKLVKAGSKAMSEEAQARSRALGRRIEAINNDLVELHKALVLHYTAQFRPHKDPHAGEDFNAAGMLGLMKAIKGYDPRYGATFASWAYQPIKREVLGAVRDHEYPTLSRGDFEQRDSIRKAIRELSQLRPGVVPTDEEIAALTGCRVSQVQRIREAASPVSLQAQMSPSGESDTEIGDLLEDSGVDIEGQVITAMSLEALQRYGLACLTERELYVLIRRFGLDGEPREKLQQIGRALGISREAARQIEAKARAKLNHPLVLQHLTPSGRKPSAGAA